jgi:putative transposase
LTGGTFFFTVVTERRAPILDLAPARTALRDAIRACRDRWPFRIEAMVLLPDHLHAIWSLPSGDTAYPRRWGWIKKEFTRAWLAAGGDEQLTTISRPKRSPVGVGG